MTLLHVFGYGSLVDARTHAHPLTPATLPGWRRVWREVRGRDFAILSVTRDPSTSLQGVVMPVPIADLPALDAREAMYVRQDVCVPGVTAPIVYEVQDHLPRATKPILRSYLDVVLAGHEAVFGADGAAEFYRTTSGWEVGLYDDRDAPIYPRHQPITAQKTATYDSLHNRMTAVKVAD